MTVPERPADDKRKTHILSVWGAHKPLCGARGDVRKAENQQDATCQKCNPPGTRVVTFTVRRR